MNNWILKTTQYRESTHLHDVPVYTLGNGLVGCRGFFEEQQNGIAALGGIYMARVFGKANYTPWTGVGRELVNVPDFFFAKLSVNGEPLCIDETSVRDFSVQLNLFDGTLQRTYTYYKDSLPLLKLSFSRFISRADIFTCGQSISVTPLVDGLNISVLCGINTNITNLNEKSCEPWPIQPGNKHCRCISRSADAVIVSIDEPENILLGFGQTTECDETPCEKSEDGHIYNISVSAGQTKIIKKLVSLSLSPEDGNDIKAVLSTRMKDCVSYDEAIELHKNAMKDRWSDADIRIDGSKSDEDQLALRYNIFQLMQAAPEHTELASIGARGLTGEMYEGSIFWDTEIFMLPFFTFTRPSAAKKLLRYRVNTLPQARKHAKSNLLDGAMYGWQVNLNGEEQTPQGVGAFYSIHVIADIAYAVLEYWYATGDLDFMLNGGLSILIETSRFWASRAQQREDGKYDIMAVRGPNEYDVIVNNNLYTNMMARENIRLCLSMLSTLSSTDDEAVSRIKNELNFKDSETTVWTKMADNLILPYEPKRDLWLEDDAYLRRRPLDMKMAKPTGKRIIDTTIPYEALPLYQVTKQGDVLHVMKNLPWYFTDTQMQNAYDFYEPRTAFDSSLAYSMFSLMAARLDRMDTASDYFERTANLDIKNVQLNTISGLHFANFGGTWQAAVMGFGGVSVHENSLHIAPHLPPHWDTMEFTLYYKGTRLCITIGKHSVSVKADKLASPVCIKLLNKEYTLTAQCRDASAEY